jgi:hypothetical protein
MPRDQFHSPAISAKAVLSAVNDVRRRGRWTLLQQLEHDEPELTEQVLEGLSAVHQTLLESGVSSKLVRRLQRQVQTIVLVTVICVRKAAGLSSNPEAEASRDSPEGFTSTGDL